jgi:hypothetical protein
MTPRLGAKTNGAEHGHIGAILPGTDYLAQIFPASCKS